MREFLRFYGWGLEVKRNMALYTLALIFFKGIVVLIQGGDSLGIWMMLQMMLACFALAVVQYALLSADCSLPRRQARCRTAVWAVCGNVLIAGGAVVFHWFVGVSPLGGAILLLLLEVMLFAMWYGERVACRRDAGSNSREQ